MSKFFLFFAKIFLCLLVLQTFVFAHGGEDHGDSKPQVITTQGIISNTKRVGDVELLVKFLPFTPDMPNSARLFFSHFATNETIKDISPTVAIVDQNGNSQEVVVKKNETTGGYDLRVPPIVRGKADFRIEFKHDGKTETVTFGNISVEPKAELSPLGTSYFVFALWLVTFVVLLSLFCGLAYAVWQSASQINRSSSKITHEGITAQV